MNCILLLGAGFSFNWGGWLASEAFEYLLGSRVLDEAGRNLLWKHKDTGFEQALSELQRGGAVGSDSSLRRMEDAIRLMFEDMNRGFFSDNFRFEFMYPPERGTNSVSEFLSRFDAIFSLNQDLLIEIGYLTIEPPQSLNPRWSSFELPGMMQRVQPQNLLPRARWPSTWCPIPSATTVAPSDARTQPFYKLHGSSNWVDEAGDRLLIMGGDKTNAINGSRILSMYSNEFSRRLKQPDTRVMIIGYGFHDQHITAALNAAADEGGLKSFIIDPSGADAPDPYRNRQHNVKTQGSEQSIQKVLIGASRRPLGKIFGGSDTIERDKVLRFFDP